MLKDSNMDLMKWEALHTGLTFGINPLGDIVLSGVDNDKQVIYLSFSKRMLESMYKILEEGIIEPTAIASGLTVRFNKYDHTLLLYGKDDHDHPCRLFLFGQEVDILLSKINSKV